MTEILLEWTARQWLLALKITTKIEIKILQGSAVAQNASDGLILYTTFLQLSYSVRLSKIMKIGWETSKKYWDTVYTLSSVNLTFVFWDYVDILALLFSASDTTFSLWSQLICFRHRPSMLH